MSERKFLDRKLDAVAASRIAWVRRLAAAMAVLHEVYQAHSRGELELPKRALATIGAALYYFVNPSDIIPDHVPGRGYLDDAYVLELCVGAVS